MHARLVLIFILLNCKLAGQTIKLDSLKSSMAILTAQKQVDALNSLGWEYYLKWIHSDSALKFAGLAEKKIPVNKLSGWRSDCSGYSGGGTWQTIR